VLVFISQDKPLFITKLFQALHLNQKHPPPIVGDMTIGYEVLALTPTPGLSLTTYLAEPGTPSGRSPKRRHSPHQPPSDRISHRQWSSR
jgi:hypothetical protein